jgi:hypothetical protein
MPTTADVKAVLAGVLHQQSGAASVNPLWEPIIAQALAQATADCQSVLAAQGYTAAQLAGWAGWETSVTTQAVYYCLVLGAALLPTPVNGTEIAALDQRKQLATAVLTDAAGNLIRPDPSSNVAGHGVIRGGFRDVAARDWRRRMGFLDPATGRLRDW